MMPLQRSGYSFFFLIFFFFASALCTNVTYDHRALIINGQRKLLMSASIHYPRSVPAMWPGLVAAAKEGGIDVIESYVFWNGHEISPGKYYFGGRFDLVKFVKIIRDARMYMMLRIGPFVAAEWNFGGVPVWLHYVPGTVFRTDSEPFKTHVQSFTTYIVEMMKKERLFASQGGPIILAQVENEYGDIESVYGKGGKPYAMWSAKMALSQNIGVPWIMCQQYDAPDPVINTCNSFYCDQFQPNSVKKPKIWTENWPGWFNTFGSAIRQRPPEDIAYAVARFFQNGGSLNNYYMYHGGTNFDRTSGGPFITTSYDYDAPLDEYGLLRLPKWGHLKDLHKAIKLCEHALLYGEAALVTLGPLQEATVYTDLIGNCAAFLANLDEEMDKTVVFQNKSYHLLPWSVSILPDCRNVEFNTAKITSQSSIVEMIPESLQASSFVQEKGLKTSNWDFFVEKIGVWHTADLKKTGFVDHINTTKDTTDYLWYTTSFHFHRDQGLLRNGSLPVLKVESKGHAVHVFVNKKLQVSSSGNGARSSFKFESPITLKHGKNKIALLSMTVGLQNAGPFYEWVGAGLTSVKISHLKGGSIDLSSNTWVYKIGLEGEYKNIYSEEHAKKVKWISMDEVPKNQPLTWYKTTVHPPSGQDPIALDMEFMGKGRVWLNGEAIGRYWPRKSSIHDKCSSTCNYRGKFFPDKCGTGCGQPTQRWYHIPRSWFRPSGNTLVIFEEKGGDPSKIKFARRRATSICGSVAEAYPLDLGSMVNANGKKDTKTNLYLACSHGSFISAIKFASFGTPAGSCGSYSQGICHYANSVHVVKEACLNKNNCAISLSEKTFGNNIICPGTIKKLSVEVACS